MGTLFDQQPRNHRDVNEAKLDDFLSTVVRLSQEHEIAVSDVIAARRVLELERRNGLYIDNGDAFDEQIGGVGKLLQSLTIALEGLKDAD